MKRLLVLFILLCSCASAATLTGSIEFRVRSHISDLSAFGPVSDNVDYSWPVEVSAPSQVYHADRSLTPAAPDVLGMVGSLTNALGQTVTFSTVQAVYFQNLGTGSLSVTGLATATIPPSGTLTLTGDRPIASFSDRLTVAATATSSYRVWLIGY